MPQGEIFLVLIWILLIAGMAVIAHRLRARRRSRASGDGSPRQDARAMQDGSPVPPAQPAQASMPLQTAHPGQDTAARREAAVGKTEPVPGAAEVDPGRRDFLRKGAMGFTIISVGGPLAGSVSRDDEFEVVYKTVRIKNLPPRIEGFRIAMISDIHSGPYMDRKDIVPYVARVNRLRPDAILLPGDFVQNKNEEIEPVCDTLRRLEAPYGVYGSTGNHDYFADADYISKELELAGVRMLRNGHTVLDVDGAPLALVGLDDVRSGHPFDDLFRKAVDGLDARIPNVVLCHKPYYLEEASQWGVDLMVSGHTHGGQIVLARVFDTVITPAALISGYIEGLYRLDATQLYVTRGIGTVGLPIRLNCPPEITVLTLQREAD